MRAAAATAEAQEMWEMKGGIESESPRSEKIGRGIKKEIKKQESTDSGY